MHPDLSTLERLARQAGDILRGGYEQAHQVDYKGEINPVTEMDHKSEALVLGEIQRLFPGHRIISEEAGLLPGREGDQWYVDPLDGTVNYAHGVPIFTVSIAYAHNGILTLGVVYDPMRDEIFTAQLGQGSRMNGRKLQVSKVSELRRSLMVTGFPYDAWSTQHDNLDNFGRFARLTQGVRRLGSAALDLSYIAAGRVDGYWELSLSPWDIAAGALIALEAGATVTRVDGGADFITSPCSIMAASPELYGKMKAVLDGKTYA